MLWLGSLRLRRLKAFELASVWFTGEKIETQDVKADIEIRAGAEWTRRFLEDASWNVLERAELGRAVALLETERIVKLFTSIANADLAGGAEIAASTSGKLTYEDIVKARRAVKAERFKPDCLLVSANKDHADGKERRNKDQDRPKRSEDSKEKLTTSVTLYLYHNNNNTGRQSLNPYHKLLSI